MRDKPWFDRHIADGLMAYWLYQHLGNLSISARHGSELFGRVLAAGSEGDAGSLLRQEMSDADYQPGHSRWSFVRDLGPARLLVIDSRAGREVAPGRRRLIDDGEWQWIRRQASGVEGHLLPASSVPFFLPPGLHHTEAWAEAVADGAWGRLLSPAGDRIRRAAVMDHWAAFQRSFRELGELLRDLAGGRLGPRPDSVVMLSGDVHHCYVAEVGLKAPAPAGSPPVWQCVCSAYRKQLARQEKALMRLGATAVAGRVGRWLARTAGVPVAGAAARLVTEPRYGNQVATLTLSREGAEVAYATTEGADWREPRLTRAFEHRLC